MWNDRITGVTMEINKLHNDKLHAGIKIVDRMIPAWEQEVDALNMIKNFGNNPALNNISAIIATKIEQIKTLKSIRRDFSNELKKRKNNKVAKTN